MADITKTDVLQGFLDGQSLMLELFDAVEACEEGALVIDVKLLIRLRRVVDALDAVQSALTFTYMLSGRAADDVIASIRSELGEG